ncbi:DMT family transporter [Wohlfahrtiimonas chitiniclastica]|uniref:DMT family transporter n=1 Tax=Wohlfahrtiimonas chitiniclastica TaxID=400946 RepID=UPI0021583AA3|nr:DMT family transporter [Wohlfahrtiimonas chitiniclastica]
MPITFTPPLNAKSAVIKMSIAMILFGSVGFFSERSGVPALELVFIRCICAMLFLGLFWILSGKLRHEKWHVPEVLRILLCSVFLILNWVYFFKAIEVSGVTVAISIYHLAPVIVMILGAFIYKERLTLIPVLAIVICFVGTLAIAEINRTASVAEFFSPGLIFGLLSALFYALLTLTGKGFKYASSYAITTIQVAFGALLLVPFVDFSAFNGLTELNWFYIAITGFVHTGIVFYLFFDAIRHLSTQMIAILVFLDPLVAILMDLFITGFIPSMEQWIGIVLIFGGMALTLMPKKKATLI